MHHKRERSSITDCEPSVCIHGDSSVTFKPVDNKAKRYANDGKIHTGVDKIGHEHQNHRRTDHKFPTNDTVIPPYESISHVSNKYPMSSQEVYDSSNCDSEKSLITRTPGKTSRNTLNRKNKDPHNRVYYYYNNSFDSQETVEELVDKVNKPASSNKCVQVTVDPPTSPQHTDKYVKVG